MNFPPHLREGHAGAATQRERILDPVQRQAEILFGLIMVLSFTGTISVTSADDTEVREVLLGAIGCNLAWAIIDAVMFLMAIVLERGRNLTIGRAIQASQSPEHGQRLLASVLPDELGEVFDANALESGRRKIAAAPPLAQHPRFDRRDWLGALGVFLLVFLSTFPVVIPFLFDIPLHTAMRISNAVAITMLYVLGHRLGHYSGMRPLRTGLAMVTVGVVLVAATIALGGLMRRFLPCAALLAWLAAPAAAQEPPADPDDGAGLAAPSEEPAWEFAGAVYYSNPPGSDDRLTPIIYADRGSLHLELRHNYEDLDTTSIFAGWTFERGEEVEFAATPMLGTVFGDTDGVAPGVELDLAWQRLAWYTEAEYLFDSGDSDDNFFYSWSSLTYAFNDSLSAGFVTERTKLVDTDHDFQRGLALNFSIAGLAFSVYAYNFTSDDFYAVVALNLTP